VEAEVLNEALTLIGEHPGKKALADLVELIITGDGVPQQAPQQQRDPLLCNRSRCKIKTVKKMKKRPIYEVACRVITTATRGLPKPIKIKYYNDGRKRCYVTHYIVAGHCAKCQVSLNNVKFKKKP
jgi:hypothetical protein